MKRESIEEICERGRGFRDIWSILLLISSHIKRCDECKKNWNEIREHIGLKPIE